MVELRLKRESSSFSLDLTDDLGTVDSVGASYNFATTLTY